MNEVDVNWRGKCITINYINAHDHQYLYTSSTKRFYEFNYLNYIHYVGRTNGFKIAYDIGTCFANHSVFFGAVMGCKVYCFEPNSTLHETILKTLSSNNVDYQLLGVALGETEGTGSLEKSQANIGSSKVISPKHDGDIFNIHTLDGIIKENQLQTPDFLKIDTEGFELHVLKGGINLLKENAPDIFVEIDKANKERVYKFFQKHGYQFITRIGKNYHFSKKSGTIKKLKFSLKAILYKLEKDLFKARQRIKHSIFKPD